MEQMDMDAWEGDGRANNRALGEMAHISAA